MPKEDKMKHIVLSNDAFGSAGGDIMAESSKPTFDAVAQKVVDYVEDARKKRLVKIPEASSEKFFAALRKNIAGTDATWKASAESHSQFGSASGDLFAEMLREAANEMPRTVRKFIDKQIAAGNITVTDDKKSQFFAGLTAASDMSKGRGKK